MSVIVTDDLVAYKIVSEKMDLGHQICQFRMLRKVGRTLHDLHEPILQEWL